MFSYLNRSGTFVWVEWRDAKSVKSGKLLMLNKYRCTSGWQSCRCKAGGSFVVAKLILLLQTCIPFCLQLPTSSLWRQVPVAAILHLWRHSDSDSPAVVNILLQINESVNVLAYVCSQQGDIRTPHPNVKSTIQKTISYRHLKKVELCFVVSSHAFLWIHRVPFLVLIPYIYGFTPLYP